MRIDQRPDESPDIFAMRAYAKALPLMNDNALRAFAGWINAHAHATLIKRGAVVRGRTQREVVIRALANTPLRENSAEGENGR